MEHIGTLIRKMRRNARLLPLSAIALFTGTMESLRRKRKEQVQRVDVIRVNFRKAKEYLGRLKNQ